MAMVLLEQSPFYRAAAQASLARALVLRARPAEALAEALAAQALFDSVGGPEENEASVMLALAEAHAAVGDRQRARATLEDARERLLARAARVEEPARRRGLLERVPTHARILELAGQCTLGSDAPR